VKERAGGADGGGVDPGRGCALAEDFLPMSGSFYRAPCFFDYDSMARKK
jgi:hypothetical protein